MTMEENVHGEVSDIFKGPQEVEDKCDVENGDDQSEVDSYCNADSHVTEKKEVLLDNGDGKNDIDSSYVFVSGSEVVAADVDPGESDLNVGDCDEKSNTGENVPCSTVDSHGSCTSLEHLKGELSSGASGENNYPAEHDKSDERHIDTEILPLPESQVMVSEAAECEWESQQLLSTSKDCTGGSMASAGLGDEFREIKINSAMSPESNHHVDGENVGRGSESASAKESQELKNVVIAVVDKEPSEFVENVGRESESVSVTDVRENKEFNNLVGEDIQNSPGEENGANKYIENENVGRRSESVSVPDSRESQEVTSTAKADAQNNLANEKNLSEYVDEIVIEGRPVSGVQKLEEELEQDLTTYSCLVADMKKDTDNTNGTVSNENKDGLITGYIQDRVSTTVDSNQIAGEHHIPFEIIESDIGSTDSSQDTSQRNGLMESAKTSPVPVSGENASTESNQCNPCEDKIENLKSSSACIMGGASAVTECGNLGTKTSEIADSSILYESELIVELDNGLLMDKPTLSDHATTNAGTSSVNDNASGGFFDNDTEIDVESHAKSSTEKGSKLHASAVEDVILVPETENLTASSLTDTPGDGVVIPNMNGDAVDSEDAPSVDMSIPKEEDQFLSFDGTREIKLTSDIHGDEDSKPTGQGSTEDSKPTGQGSTEDSKPTGEGSTVELLDGQNMGAEVVKKPFYFLIRLPRYDDDGNIKEQIKNAQFQVDDKTRKRDAIRAEIQIKKATCKECGQDVEAAISAEKAARDLLKSKRQEMDSVQSIINRLNNALFVEDIDGRIRNMEHMIEHETLPLKEEKNLLRQIKQLKQQREELLSNLGKQDQLQLSLDNENSIEEHFKRLQLLKKEVESLRQNVLKVEAVTKAAKKRYHDENSKLSELLAQFKAADDIRQEAYAKLQALRKQLYEKNKNFWDYKNAQSKANELAAEGKREELQCFCVNQVESIMQLWNQNDEFRREYVRCNTRSTLRRLRTLDGRSLGADEEPPVIPSVFNERASRDSTSSLNSTLGQPKKAGSSEIVNLEDKPVSEVSVQRSLPTKTKKPLKSPPVENSVVMVSSLDEVEDVREEPTRTKEEEELMLKAEEVRKEEEAAKLKEKRRIEEIAKAKEAMLRKKRNADNAQQRAAIKAQKEAEQKEKEREKRARKKEKKKAAIIETVDDISGESAPSTEALTRTAEECDHSQKSVDVTKRQQKASQSIKPTKAKSIPPPIRNRGRRRMQSYMWVLITILVVVSLFFLGNSNLFLRLGLQEFGF